MSPLLKTHASTQIFITDSYVATIVDENYTMLTSHWLSIASSYVVAGYMFAVSILFGIIIPTIYGTAQRQHHECS